jgi:hypothetical protein
VRRPTCPRSFTEQAKASRGLGRCSASTGARRNSTRFLQGFQVTTNSRPNRLRGAAELREPARLLAAYGAEALIAALERAGAPTVRCASGPDDDLMG